MSRTVPGMRRLLVLCLVVACKSTSEAPPPPTPTPPPPAHVGDAGVARPYRTPASTFDVDPKVAASAKTYMVATESEHATKVGEDMLAAGGNAVDAASRRRSRSRSCTRRPATSAAAASRSCASRKARPSALDFRETAPAAATRDMYLDADGKPTKDSLIGDRASRRARLRRRALRAPPEARQEDVDGPARARDRARDEMASSSTTKLHDSLVHGADALARVPGERRALAARAASRARPARSSRSRSSRRRSQRIADKGAAGFYQGPTADAIVAEMKAGGGLITAAISRATRRSGASRSTFDVPRPSRSSRCRRRRRAAS